MVMAGRASPPAAVPAPARISAHNNAPSHGATARGALRGLEADAVTMPHAIRLIRCNLAQGMVGSAAMPKQPSVPPVARRHAVAALSARHVGRAGLAHCEA